MGWGVSQPEKDHHRSRVDAGDPSGLGVTSEKVGSPS